MSKQVRGQMTDLRIAFFILEHMHDVYQKKAKHLWIAYVITFIMF